MFVLLFLLVARENMHRFVETTVYDFSEFQKELEQLSYEKEMSRMEVAPAKKTILTNLHVDLDYQDLKKKLPKY